jgi:putative aldouronate transport system permease protein
MDVDDQFGADRMVLSPRPITSDPVNQAEHLKHHLTGERLMLMSTPDNAAALLPQKKRQAAFYIRSIIGNWQLYLLLLLPLAYIIVFKYIPMYGAQIAFRNYNPIDGFLGSEWVGMTHLLRFIKSPTFPNLMINTLSLSLYNLVAGFPFPIILALALHYVANKRFKKVVQMATYIPNFISIVVIIGILVQILNIRTGVVNQAVQLLGNKPIDFFGRPEYFSSLFVWSGIWQTCGWSSVIYLSALSGIDPQLYEAAIIDGASKIRRIWHIDLPGILPMMVILLILSLGTFMSNGFEKVYLMQNPLNLSASEVIDTYVYKMGLASQAANFSYAAAIGLFQSLTGFILIVIANSVSKKLTDSSIW